MHPLAFVTLGFAPGLFWLWMVVRGNLHRPDPMSLVLRTFLLGVAIAVPVVVVEHILQGADSAAITSRMSLGEAAFLAFVVAGLVEEFGKFLVIRLSLYDSPYFDEPLRGLVYAAAVALGFASIENVHYMLQFGPAVLLPRALLSTLAHVFFAGLWGYGLGADRKARRDGAPARGFAFLGLTGGIVAHGAFDVFLFIGEEPLAVLTFLASGAAFVALLVRANHRSIHRGRTAPPAIACPTCAAMVVASSRFCTTCGSRMAQGSVHTCGGCKAPLVGRPAYCSACGFRVADA